MYISFPIGYFVSAEQSIVISEIFELATCTSTTSASVSLPLSTILKQNRKKLFLKIFLNHINSWIIVANNRKNFKNSG